jgi:hypothetical protein
MVGVHYVTSRIARFRRPRPFDSKQDSRRCATGCHKKGGYERPGNAEHVRT